MKPVPEAVRESMNRVRRQRRIYRSGHWNRAAFELESEGPRRETRAILEAMRAHRKHAKAGIAL